MLISEARIRVSVDTDGMGDARADALGDKLSDVMPYVLSEAMKVLRTHIEQKVTRATGDDSLDWLVIETLVD